MKASFENSVSVLVRAYMNDTLVHGACTACAVGNLVASAMGTKQKKGSFGRWYIHNTGFYLFDRTDEEVNRCFSFENGVSTEWQNVFSTSQGDQRRRDESYFGAAKEQIDSTGYSVDQLASIEYAFESAPIGGGHDTWMFNGLMAVVEVLADIHQVDLSVKEQAIGQFKEVQLAKA